MQKAPAKSTKKAPTKSTKASATVSYTHLTLPTKA